MSRVLTLKLWHPGCWTLDVTEEMAGLQLEANRISRFAPYNVADTLVQADSDVLEAFLRWVHDDPRLVHSDVLSVGNRHHDLRLFAKYEMRRSILDLLFSNHMYPLEPLTARDGYEYAKVYTPLDDGLAYLLEDPTCSDCEIDALAVHTLDGYGEQGEEPLTETVTPRQLTVARQALEMGYYSWPRKVSGKEVARRLGLSPPTVLEHLRKFECKVVQEFLHPLPPAERPREDAEEGKG